MQHHSTTRQEAATATALVLSVVKEKESTPAESFHLHIASRNHVTAAHKPYHQNRRSTIDDNGGSYEGL